jgi:omega-6 fatty acid desaturase (delta-12 desaturase)
MVAAGKPQQESIRERMKAFRQASFPIAASLVFIDVTLYLLSFGLGAMVPWPMKAFLAPLLALEISRLFVLGHDASHGSLFPSARWNRSITHLLMLPSAVPATSWALGHNSIHHAFTNLKGRDHIWVPFSPREWLALPLHRRWRERFYRNPAGFGAYYFVELWWSTLFFPSLPPGPAKHPGHIRDGLFVVLFFLAQCAVCAEAREGFAANLLWLVLVPHALWCWGMGISIFLHHTRPEIHWLDRREEWSFVDAQVESARPATVPGWINRILHNIFDHRAHHLDARIPCYRLPEAEKVAQQFSPSQSSLPPEPFWRDLLRTCRICQLYDYEQKRWVPFF